MDKQEPTGGPELSCLEITCRQYDSRMPGNCAVGPTYECKAAWITKARNYIDRMTAAEFASFIVRHDIPDRVTGVNHE